MVVNLIMNLLCLYLSNILYVIINISKKGVTYNAGANKSNQVYSPFERLINNNGSVEREMKNANKGNSYYANDSRNLYLHNCFFKSERRSFQRIMGAMNMRVAAHACPHSPVVLSMMTTMMAYMIWVVMMRAIVKLLT